MGILGVYITVHNQTDRTLTMCLEFGVLWTSSYKIKVEPQERKTDYYYTLSSLASFKVKLGDRSEQECCEKPDLLCEFKPKDDTLFTIRESNDRQYIELDCNKNHEKKKSKCPNYG